MFTLLLVVVPSRCVAGDRAQTAAICATRARVCRDIVDLFRAAMHHETFSLWGAGIPALKRRCLALLRHFGPCSAVEAGVFSVILGVSASSGSAPPSQFWPTHGRRKRSSDAAWGVHLGRLNAFWRC